MHLRRIFPLIFHTASALSAPSGHLPLAGKAVCRGYRFPLPTSAPMGHLLPKEGGSIHASPFPWKGLPSAARRGWLPFLRRSGALVYRLLETIPLALFHTASTLSAPSGHLPLEGKAVCREYRFPPPTPASSGHLLPKEGGSIHASPFPWKGLPSAARRGWLPFLRRSGALVYRLLETIPLALFHTASTLSAPSGHLPLEGKAVCREYRFPPPTPASSGHLLPKEGGSIHASPFPWKGLPSAARRGWLPFLRRSRHLNPEP